VPGPLGRVPVTEPTEWVRAMERQLRDGADTLMGARLAAQRPIDHRGEAVVGRFELDLNLPPADRARVAAHLAESAVMSRSAYAAGQVHLPTAEVVDFEERLAAALADSSGLAVVTVKLDGEQARKVRRWLLASKERAGDSAAVGETLGRIAREWELFTGYSPRQDAAESAWPPRVVSDAGGWDSP
jgi:hypothetical protein